MVTLRFDVAMKIWFHKRDPLFDTSFYIPPSFSDISRDLLSFSISKQPYDTGLELSDALLRARHRSASASANIFMSNNSKIRGSYSANIPSRTST